MFRLRVAERSTDLRRSANRRCGLARGVTDPAAFQIERFIAEQEETAGGRDAHRALAMQVAKSLEGTQR